MHDWLLDACLTARPCRAQQSLGTRHVTYGVEPEHYEWVGAALIDTLATALGDAFDADTKAAYLCVYGESASRLRQSPGNRMISATLTGRTCRRGR